MDSSSSSSLQKQHQDLALRIIDANLNRLRDALRVIEDTLRFGKANSTLWLKVRKLRNRIIRLYPAKEFYTSFLVSRDSSNDPGRNTPQKPYKDITSILNANFARSSEALRVLEEYSRLLSPTKIKAIKGIRFSLYEIEKRIPPID